MIIGSGSQQRVVEQLVRRLARAVSSTTSGSTRGRRRDALDDATVLVLPSWPEGLGRVIIESFARGRAVVATDAGGIPDLVTHEVEGLLVPPADPTTLASALARVLGDRELAARMGAAARARYADWHSTPEELAPRDARARRRDDRRHRSLSAAPLRHPEGRRRPSGARADASTSSRELAARFEAVDVLCDAVGPARPARERARCAPSAPRTRVGRGVAVRARRSRPRCCRARRGPTPCSSHMVPLFALLAAPLVKPLRIPMLLWYTHWHAEPVAAPGAAARRRRHQRQTAARSRSRRRSCSATGHAIDVEQFSPGRGAPRDDGPLRLLALGRTARWKGYDTMLEALEPGCPARLRRAARDPRAAADRRRARTPARAGGGRRAPRPSCATASRIEPPLPRDELPALLAGADALLSATQPRGSETLDKVVYEAAACGVPVLASNAALKEFLGGLPLELSLPAAGRRGAGRAARRPRGGRARGRARETGAELRRRVVAGHSVGSWADAVTRDRCRA